MKKLLLLGASGSIGTQTLDILKTNKLGYTLVGISVGRQIGKIEQILKDFPTVKYVYVLSDIDKDRIKKNFKKVKFYSGTAGIKELLNDSNPDTVLNALVGFVGVEPSFEALKLNKDLLLANKETLVVGGNLFNELRKKSTSLVYPIDSEHCAISKCLRGKTKEEVKRLLITCSGGPFINKNLYKLKNIKPKDALKHPNWNMGQKITIDSATLINKVFEVIEAYYLFNDFTENIDVILHPQSYVHSFVEFNDGSYLADVGNHDMRIPIQYALSYGKYTVNNLNFDLTKAKKLEFVPLSDEKKDILNISKQVIERKGNTGAIIVAADDFAVNNFLTGKIKFTDIYDIINAALENVRYIKKPKLEDLLKTNELTLDFCKKYIEG